MITTLEEALKRISELEAENANLKAELEEYRGRKFAGRQKHDAAWTQSYNDFAVKFESGMTIMEIVAEGKISRRTAYRYKAYYDALRQTEATLEISNLRLCDSLFLPPGREYSPRESP